MRTSIWLVRHAQTTANRARRYQSRSDSSLTPYGLRQIEALAARLRRIPFRLAVASPSQRTRQTAAAILAGRDLEPRLDPAWAEADHGRWEGLTYPEVLERYPDEARARWAAGIHGRPAGGESLADAIGRVTAAWRRLLADNPGGRILIVSHATPIQIALCVSLGLDPAAHWRWRIDLGSLTALDIYPGGSTIVRMVNEIPELRRV